MSVEAGHVPDTSMEWSANRYETMPYRRCGGSGLRLPLIALGGWHNFGIAHEPDEMKRTVFRAFDRGITYFDLANNYGPPPGQAEIALGAILQHLPRHEIVVATKAGYRMHPGPYGEWGGRKHLLDSLDQSLRRLGVDHVDIFYHHRPDPETPLEESVGALQQAIRAGKALYPAVSNYAPEAAVAADRLLRRHDLQGLVANQVRYNLFDRAAESWPSTAGDPDIGMVAYSPLAQGLLTERYRDGVPSGSRAARVTWDAGDLKASQITPHAQARIRALTAVAARRGQSLAQMCLAWVLRSGGPAALCSVIVGVSRVEQMEENLAAVQSTSFADAELSEIDRISAAFAQPAAGLPDVPAPAL